MFRTKLIVLIFVALLALPSVAFARYCNNPQCAMCNRIFGPMPGYKVTVTGRGRRVATQAVRIAPAVQAAPACTNCTESGCLTCDIQAADVPVPIQALVGTAVPRSFSLIQTNNPAFFQAATNLPETPSLLFEDSVFEPMPQEAVNAMLQQVYPLEGEVLYDLGCGDGRILIEAVSSFGCRAVGIEINPETVALAKQNVEDSGFGRILIVQGNVKDYNLDDADVITMYLFPELIEELLPHIRPGTRVVSFEHEIPGVDCTRKTAMVGDVEYTFYTWVKDSQRAVGYAMPESTQPVRPFSLVH